MSQILPWHDDIWQRLNRVRTRQRLPHALLFTGQAGLGKLQLAQRLARALLCEANLRSGDACGECRQCRLMQAENHPDWHFITVQEGNKQIRVDDIRTMLTDNQLRVEPGCYRIFLVAPAHAMNIAAANALLKMLEEPVEGALLLLVSDAPQRLPITIRSRCQQLQCSPPGQNIAMSWLQQQIGEDRPVEAALDMHSGAPLAALESLKDGTFEQFQQMKTEFFHLIQKSADPVQTGEAWLQQASLETVLGYLAFWLVKLVQKSLGSNTENQGQSLQSQLKRLDLSSVYQLLDKVYAAQQQQNNNLNSQMVLESLLLDWVNTTQG